MDRETTQPPAQASSADYVDAAFDGLVQSSMAHWVRYAHLHVGNREDAEQIAYETAFQLQSSWEHILSHQANVPLHALGLLRSEIERWRQEHGVEDPLVENAAFLRAMRAGQSDFALLAESLGVYGAIARLPERQHQAVVLRFALGYDVRLAAGLMGVSPATISSLTHSAKRNLAKDLGIDVEELDTENPS